MEAASLDLERTQGVPRCASACPCKHSRMTILRRCTWLGPLSSDNITGTESTTATCTSLQKGVTRLACVKYLIADSKSSSRYASLAFCRSASAMPVFQEDSFVGTPYGPFSCSLLAVWTTDARKQVFVFSLNNFSCSLESLGFLTGMG